MPFDFNNLADLLMGKLGTKPDEEPWDAVWNERTPVRVKFSKPEYEAVRVSSEFMLVRVPQQQKPE